MNHQTAMVSVVLCTYNGGAYLQEQLDSILKQTHTHLEIIIVDDGSTDNTYAIIAAIANEDSRIRYFKNLHQLGYNRNYEQALKYAQGTYIAIADQDDIWRLDKIEILLARLTDSSCAMVYCHAEDFNQSPPLHTPSASKYSGAIQYFEGKDSRKLLLRNSVSGHCMVFRRTLLNDAFPFDEAVFYDLWLAVVACANGGIQFCKETLVFRRRHSQNASLAFLSAQQEQLNPYHFLITILHKTITAPHLPIEAKKYSFQLSKVLAFSKRGAMNWKLFLFLIQHRHIVFHYKPPKLLSFFSHMKHSVSIAKGYLVEKGI